MKELQRNLKKSSKMCYDAKANEVKPMSRTIRKTDGWIQHPYRYPHTFSEIKKLDALVHEEDLDDYIISKLNRIKSREHSLPTVYDDIVVSAYYEVDHE